jgi:hypothetical protein
MSLTPVEALEISLSLLSGAMKQVLQPSVLGFVLEATKTLKVYHQQLSSTLRKVMPLGLWEEPLVLRRCRLLRWFLSPSHLEDICFQLVVRRRPLAQEDAAGRLDVLHPWLRQHSSNSSNGRRRTNNGMQVVVAPSALGLLRSKPLVKLSKDGKDNRRHLRLLVVRGEIGGKQAAMSQHRPWQ